MNWEKMKSSTMDGTEVLALTKSGERFIVRYDAEKAAWLSVPGNYKKEPVRWAALPAALEKFTK